MHPPLDRPHPQCQDVIIALRRCHCEHPYLKFVGYCNEKKYALNRCFKEEKLKRKSDNLEACGTYLAERRDAFQSFREAKTH